MSGCLSALDVASLLQTFVDIFSDVQLDTKCAVLGKNLRSTANTLVQFKHSEFEGTERELVSQLSRPIGMKIASAHDSEICLFTK